MSTLQDIAAGIDALTPVVGSIKSGIGDVAVDLVSIKGDLDVIAALISQLKAGALTQEQIDNLASKVSDLQAKAAEAQTSATNLHSQADSVLAEAETLKS